MLSLLGIHLHPPLLSLRDAVWGGVVANRPCRDREKTGPSGAHGILCLFADFCCGWVVWTLPGLYQIHPREFCELSEAVTTVPKVWSCLPWKACFCSLMTQSLLWLQLQTPHPPSGSCLGCPPPGSLLIHLFLGLCVEACWLSTQLLSRLFSGTDGYSLV